MCRISLKRLFLVNILGSVRLWQALGFLLGTKRRRFRISCPTRAMTKHGLAMSAADFDFSSARGWEIYYQSKKEPVIEWHSAMPLETIADQIDPASRQCLIVGCGMSRLPEVVAERRPSTAITLLDSSPTCIEQMRARYGSNMEYMTGDATNMASSLTRAPDTIVDKGLIDALLCGEGWDRSLRLLLAEAAKALQPGGVYILVSYQLPSSTKAFMEDASDGLEWEFEAAGSREDIILSFGRKAQSNR